ncbi:hypothetical protein ebA2121 [Aromatoleum aromaticum EbN1]|uniref:Uncharacterized protein n=1 Tax=Aromatoleum aromaticum (strain DSM 19018 / LMG 30748 / EbN1) TaxID=76114 RepID=Q5P5W5_AROAE|nr:hypothetical protein ebA2121 [Aromatoleum aromaticum EbN1]
MKVSRIHASTHSGRARAGSAGDSTAAGILRPLSLLAVVALDECQLGLGSRFAGQARETAPPRRSRNQARASPGASASCLLRDRQCPGDFLFEHSAGVEQAGIECRLVIHPVE